MKRIGLLSDTHGYWDERYLKYFEDCDEIWHAGDIGSEEVADRLEAFRPLRAVYGNIDGQNLRLRFRKSTASPSKAPMYSSSTSEAIPANTTLRYVPCSRNSLPPCSSAGTHTS